ncbi:MAG: thymidine phosphorylase [Anaerolineae bacterium]|nr:thymidine phosphorylase [Anaerolineae bacterium]
MQMVEIIEKKRDGGILSAEEIRFFIEGYTRSEIPDYQVSALLMAIVLNGMNDQETTDLTLIMAHSGESLDLSEIAPVVVDKHSTGGVGDKVSLIVAPTVAACGLPVGKMSGRGLGFSGGTLDKLESIPGYRVDLPVEEYKTQLSEIGIVLSGQSGNLAPADGKLYALRDVTGTVPSLPLIVSSIMSKKIAAGADAIVLDVKVGSGAFMRTLPDAKELAQAMVRIGNSVGRRVTARISDMNQPLGNAVGNILEVKEAIDALHGVGPDVLNEHCLVIAGEMLVLGGVASSLDKAKSLADQAIKSGAAFQKFCQLVTAQNGDLHYVNDPNHFPRAEIVRVVQSQNSMYLAETQTDEIGMAVVDLGGGRRQKDDAIDHRVGVIMHVKVGDSISVGQPLFTIHANSESSCDLAVKRIGQALRYSESPIAQLPLFYT